MRAAILSLLGIVNFFVGFNFGLTLSTLTFVDNAAQSEHDKMFKNYIFITHVVGRLLATELKTTAPEVLALLH